MPLIPLRRGRALGSIANARPEPVRRFLRPLIQLLLAENLRRELLKRLGFLRDAGSHHLHLALFRLVLRPQRRGEHQPGERSHTLRILASVSMKLYPRTMIRSFRDAAPRIALSAYIDRS